MRATFAMHGMCQVVDRLLNAKNCISFNTAVYNVLIYLMIRFCSFLKINFFSIQSKFLDHFGLSNRGFDAARLKLGSTFVHRSQLPHLPLLSVFFSIHQTQIMAFRLDSLVRIQRLHAHKHRQFHFDICNFVFNRCNSQQPLYMVQ